MTMNDDDMPLGDRLADLWSDEGCAFHVDYIGGAHVTEPWVVVLDWTTDREGVHGADWTVLSWLFYGESTDTALADAVEWCEALLPWEPCAECDGQGAWNGVPCADCSSTGLAHPELTS